MATDITAKYDSWKNKLLDLGKRNRLLNYRETRVSTMKIISPDCYSLWERFVQQEEPLVFPYAEEFSPEAEEIDTDSNVVTNKSVPDTQKTLRNLRNKARTALEEQGINVLYLSFGFLNWTETGDSAYKFKSPLVLVPVTITVESITSPYKLFLHEDEIVVNPTLAYKLSTDFGIVLPELNDEMSLKEYFSKVKEVIDVDGWYLENSVGLSLLSFLKINMYNDLDKHKDTILSNPIIRNIAGDLSSVERIPDNLLSYDFDANEKPVDLFQVVDADASQQDAILLAKKGVSFVLQGPPGTGKSQTITNIIAESLAAGKKVLFVSEKMAALDVVHRRLQAAGLDDFCLILHSYKANKRNVLDQLDRVLSLADERHTVAEQAYQKLERLQADKEQLNEYCKNIFTPIKPLGKTFFEVNGIIANLSDADDVVFSFENIENVTDEEYNRLVYYISQFVSTIGSSTWDYLSNPWRNATLSVVTNEFRHDVNSRLGPLSRQLKEFDITLNNLLEKVNIYHVHSFKDTKAVTAALEFASQSVQVPSDWIINENPASLQQLVTQAENAQSQYTSINNNLIETDKRIKQLQPEWSNYNGNITSSSEANNRSIEVDSQLKEPLFAIWSQHSIDSLSEKLEIVNNKIAELNSTNAEILSVYESDIFEVDYKEILKRYKTDYTSFTKVFKSQYKADKKAILACRKEVTKKLSDEEILLVIDQLKTIDELKQWFTDNQYSLKPFFGDVRIDENTNIESLNHKYNTFRQFTEYKTQLLTLIELLHDYEQKETEYKTRFGFLYSGIQTDWNDINRRLVWSKGFKECIDQSLVGREFINYVCSDEAASDNCRQVQQQIESEIQKFSYDYQWFKSLFTNETLFDTYSFDELCTRINACVNNLAALEEWIDQRNARNECVKLGLSSFINSILEHDIPSENIVPIFKKRFFRLWLDKTMLDYPRVSNFRRKTQDDAVQDFCNLDKEQFNIAKLRIKSELINGLPSLDRLSNGLDELSILRKELKKQRRIMPIRKLFAAIPNLLLTLKPCLMMSPLSVSLFLEAETYKFDIVIFDEASQVCTENAIGAISRGKQVVIAGDSKQLPPTNFFQVALSESDYNSDEDDDMDDVGAYESILDEANMLPERTLRWHYRSRHEDLIAFSNTKIYKSSLVTFPSNVISAPGYGVEYTYVPDGYYDRGGRKGNVKEAEKVVELIYQHIKNTPHKSLGVIAFGEIQQQAIDTILRQRRIKSPEYEYFFNEEKEEPFFVKSLENVQGDERDTIIFSIGYAKDIHGVFRMQFGPLSRSGGERRLNVAITRAKYNVMLVGSILPNDIDIDRVSADGPKLLRSYIDFAMHGTSVLEREITESDITEYDSPFEEAVYNFLDRKGYKLATQVGCSGYRIDMAVKHPSMSGVYVLGIECDGASYHSARTARERDRLRQDVLENMGWKIYRIWSTDWIKDPVTEGERLLAAVEDAISTWSINEEPTHSDDSQTMDTTEYVSIEKVEQTEEKRANPYGFTEAVKPYNYNSLQRDAYGHLDLCDCIRLIVEKEYPVHYDIVCQRVAPLYGNEKVTSKIRNEVDYAIGKLGNQIVKNGKFFLPQGYTHIPVRIPNERKINYISTPEIAEAMLTILKTCIGATPETLCAETARAFGFNRIGNNISTAMQTACDWLTRSGKAKLLEGKIVIND